MNTEKPKHTPGPWQTDEQTCMVFLPRKNAEGQRYAVACATDELQPAAGFFSAFEAESPEEPKANMRLIAAAPELLAACKLALEEAEEWIRSELEGTSQLKSALAELEPVRKAIAKAEGN